MSDYPKIEGHIKVPTGGWSFSIEDGGDAAVIDIDPGLYYLAAGPAGSLTVLIEAALNDAPELADSQPYTVTVDDDSDTSTGKVTIASDGTTFSITWTSTALRDELGYTGNLSGAATYTSPNAAPALWLPDAGRLPFYEGLFSSSAVTMAPSSKTKGLEGVERAVHDLEFYCITARKAKADFEQVVNESWQSFWRHVIKKTRRIRYHDDRAQDDEFTPYRPLNVGDSLLDTIAESATWRGEDSLWHVGPLECAVDEDG